MADAIDEFLVWSKAAGHSDDTRTKRAVVLRSLQTACGDLLGLDGDTISGWLANPAWSQWTRCAYRSDANAFYEWALLTDRISRSPMRQVPRVKTPHGIPRPAGRDVVAAVLADGSEPWITVCLLGSLAGLRAADCCRQLREDITEETIYVRNGKGNKSAELPCHPAIWEHVRDKPAGLLVVGRGGRPRSPKNLSADFNVYLSRLGLPHTKPHQLRHLYGTSLYRSTGDILLTSKLMRHASVSTTMIYTEVADDAKTAAVRGLAL